LPAQAQALPQPQAARSAACWQPQLQPVPGQGLQLQSSSFVLAMVVLQKGLIE
jgi:hypothetical protein